VFKDLKYLIAYIAPLSCFFGLWQGGVWSFTTVAITFLIIPMLEMLFPPGNQFQTEETHLLPDWFFDLILYLNLPILYGIIYWYLSMVSAGTMDVLTTIGNTLSVGIIMGATGINVAHELGHRMNKLEPWKGTSK
jgi:alkane 1-monooxygenase